MYLYESLETPEHIQAARLALPLPENTAKVEIWGSSIKDPGDDYCEIRFFDQSGNLIETTTVPGY